MRDLDRLLTNTFPEELKKVPPALVDKKAVAAKTFEKLGLEQPAKHPRPQGEWVSPTPYRRRPWAVLAACLMLAVLAGVGITLRPMLTSNAHQEPLPAGTYLECAVAKVSFDQEQWAVVLDLEAKTDLDLDHPDAPTGYDFTAYVSRTTSSTRSSLAGLNQEALTHWTKTGEDTYRCENITLEIDPVFQAQNRLMGEQDLNLELFAYFGEKNAIGTRENYLMAETPFTVDLPMPENLITPATGTYFELSNVEASFDREAWAVVLTLEANTDMVLDDSIAQQMYSWSYQLAFHTEDGDVEPSVYYGESLHSLTLWTKTGENTYQSSPLVVRLDPDSQQQRDLVGTFDATFSLTVSDLTNGENDPSKFFPTADIQVELPSPLELEPPEPATYFELQTVALRTDRNSSQVSLEITVDTDMDLTHPLAQELYLCTPSLTLFSGTANEKGAPWVSTLAQEDGSKSMVDWTREDTNRYTTTLYFSLEALLQEDPDFAGKVDCTFQLTILEKLSEEDVRSWDNMSRDFSVTLPLSANPIIVLNPLSSEEPDPDTLIIGSADGPTQTYTVP